MIELRITGEKPAEFYANAIQTLALILRPPGSGAAPAPAVVAAPDAAETPAAEPLENPKVAEAEIDPPVAATKKPRGRPAGSTKKVEAQPEQIELEAAIEAAPKKPDPKPAPPIPEGGDTVDDLFVSEKPKADAKPATVEECRAAMRTLFENYEARKRKAGEKNEDAIMAGKIAYGKRLLYGFDVPKVVDLKPEQYGAFIAAAQPYIDGTEPENAE